MSLGVSALPSLFGGEGLNVLFVNLLQNIGRPADSPPPLLYLSYKRGQALCLPTLRYNDQPLRYSRRMYFSASAQLVTFIRLAS